MSTQILPLIIDYNLIYAQESLELIYRQMLDEVDVIEKNILLAQKRASITKDVFINPNLYELAAKYYNDPLQWNIIADANKLDTPFVDGILSLVIPKNTSTKMLGVLE